MESLDFDYLKTWAARGRFVTIVFGVLSLGLGLYSQVSKLSQEQESILKNSTIFAEAFFLSTVSILLIYSVTSLLCHTLNKKFIYTLAYKEMDNDLHLIGSVVLTIAGIAEITSSTMIVQDCEENINLPSLPGYLRCHCCIYEGVKLSAGIFGILNSCAFVIAFVLEDHRLRVNNEYNEYMKPLLSTEHPDPSACRA